MEIDRSAENREVILGCGVNIKRNLAGTAFTVSLSEDEKRELENKVEQALIRAFQGAEINRMPRYSGEDALESLAETLERTAFFDESGTLRFEIGARRKVYITLNSVEHINMSAFSWSREITDNLTLLRPVERSAGEYAFDKNWGYLMSSVAECGNALTGTYVLHLPGMLKNKKLDEEIESLKNRKMRLHPVLPIDGEDSGFYCLYSVTQLGKSALDVLAELKNAAQELELKEKEAREEMIVDDTDEFADCVMRSVGILANARLMDYDELISMYSDVRMGLTERLLMGDYDDFDRFVRDMSPHSIMTAFPGISERDEEIIRADRTRKKFSEDIKQKKI